VAHLVVWHRAEPSRKQGCERCATRDRRPGSAVSKAFNIGLASLVVEEYDESRNVSPDFNRQLWRFSDAGRAEFFRLQDEHRAP
jgi:hypothetical protein